MKGAIPPFSFWYKIKHKQMMTNHTISGVLFLFSISCMFHTSNAAYNVINFGAKRDGKTDSAGAFQKAWASACTSNTAATVYVPQGTFLLKAAVFRGPCKSKITFQIDGKIIAPSDYRALGNSGYWILFTKVNRVSLIEGTFDAKGAAYWTCRRSGKNCPAGTRSVTFNWASNIVIQGLTSVDSRQTHLGINNCNNVVIQKVKLLAPGQSPNTDGIHIQNSIGVTVSSSTMKTGDDCISIGPGTKNLLMQNINCGPGHGVSIGSLGKDSNEAGVQNVTLRNSVFTGSDNGVRIKSWARSSNSFARNILFDNLIMNNVENPIIIDQNYCPNNEGCPHQSSGVKISQVTYRNIRGTSASQQAVTFDCSKSNPCQGIKIQDINLRCMDKDAISLCKNAGGTSQGLLNPKSCL